MKCHCGAPATKQSNAVIYGREYGNGMAWICSLYPECDSFVGTHADGAPLGNLADDETRRMRSRVHAVIDPMWQHGPQSRKEVYRWLSKLLGKRNFHTANLNADQCRHILALIAEDRISSHSLPDQCADCC